MKRENIIGKSEKDFKELSKRKPSKVRKDVTGNWRILTISKQCKIEEYVLSYYKKNFKDKKEIHGIVNFTTNTTTRVIDLGEFIEVGVLEYVKGEEHDAKDLFGGIELKQYWIYKDNGDIEEIK
ncbi:hypothetical protein EXN48_14670 [Clostridium botulinum]|nr:hypothetical protein [Clostridium botulinum]NFC90762.1 hypothetical protein [Clostridium botulinum]NFC99647.1 hypothetical protein [Clostridium botulinum]NFD38492.1 hypothetical protein [Clostridium botulinum]NFD42159.1 hypothetical protein [Clostridium botulinum]